MTKKDFMALAAALAMVRPSFDDTCDPYAAEYDVWLDCCQAVAQACALRNPKFDRKKFMEACNG